MGIDDLDIVLTYLYNNRRYQYIQEIHDKSLKPTGREIIDTLVVLNKLAKDGNVIIEEHKQITRDAITEEIKSSKPIDSYFISFEGVLFFEQSWWIWKNRPYTWKHIKGIISTIWTIAKIVIIVLNALAILYLMWLTVDKG